MIVSRAAVAAQLAASLSDPAAVAGIIPDPVIPDQLGSWLGRLVSLVGVPYPYLVPDERMLPPESLRFFRLDVNWLEALVDGAFSLGRNLSSTADTVGHTVDRAVRAQVHQQALDRTGQARAASLGVPAAATGLPVVSGFLLRSWLVSAYPGMGVNAYAQPAQDGAERPDALPILRFERLGRNSDTAICLVEGDAVQFDIHQAPEQLHYGIDAYSYDAASGTVHARKNAATFSGTDPVRIDGPARPVSLDTAFRAGSPRVVRASALAAAVGADNSAQLGYVMTEGVGLVSFSRDAG